MPPQKLYTSVKVLVSFILPIHQQRRMTKVYVAVNITNHRCHEESLSGYVRKMSEEETSQKPRHSPRSRSTMSKKKASRRDFLDCNRGCAVWNEPTTTAKPSFASVDLSCQVTSNYECRLGPTKLPRRAKFSLPVLLSRNHCRSPLNRSSCSIWPSSFDYWFTITEDATN